MIEVSENVERICGGAILMKLFNYLCVRSLIEVMISFLFVGKMDINTTITSHMHIWVIKQIKCTRRKIENEVYDGDSN